MSSPKPTLDEKAFRAAEGTARAQERVELGHLLARRTREIALVKAAPRQAPPSPPEERGWRELEDGLSNRDRSIPDGLAEALRGGEVWCPYAGWDFFACVWWEGDAFHAHVFQYRQHGATVRAPTLAGLMTEVSDAFGYD